MRRAALPNRAKGITPLQPLLRSTDPSLILATP